MTAPGARRGCSPSCTWEHQPTHSADPRIGIQRYRCSGCGRWGYSHHFGGYLRTIRPIKIGGRFVFAPLPKWARTHAVAA